MKIFINENHEINYGDALAVVAANTAQEAQHLLATDERTEYLYDIGRYTEAWTEEEDPQKWDSATFPNNNWKEVPGAEIAAQEPYIIALSQYQE